MALINFWFKSEPKVASDNIRALCVVLNRLDEMFLDLATMKIFLGALLVVGVLGSWWLISANSNNVISSSSTGSEKLITVNATESAAKHVIKTAELTEAMKLEINTQFSDRDQQPKIRKLDGGGYAVDISKRFPHVPVATVDDNGGVSVSEYDAPIKINK